MVRLSRRSSAVLASPAGDCLPAPLSPMEAVASSRCLWPLMDEAIATRERGMRTVRDEAGTAELHLSSSSMAR